jgi:hypothetical protein
MSGSLTQEQFMTSARYLIFLAGNWLATHNYISDSSVNTMVSAVLILGPLAWAYLNNWLKNHKGAAENAAAVQAGIELVTQGKALASDGSTLVSVNSGMTPPKPVTVETAKEIIRDFAPDPKAVAKS